MNLQLTQIRIDGGTQSRIEINNDVVSEYAEELKNGASFPQLTVFFDGVDYWLVDGFHRYHAHKLACIDNADCDVHNGSLREAQLFSVGVNGTHGLRRSNGDKKKAIELLLNDSEWSLWSDTAIAKKCSVDHKTVSKYRLSLGNSQVSENKERTYTTKHGTQAVMNTEKIGSKVNQVESDSTKQVAPQLLNKPKAETISTDDGVLDDDFDPMAILNERDAEISQLNDTIKSLTKGDLEKELFDVRTMLVNAQSERDNYKTMLAKEKKSNASAWKILNSIGDELGLDDYRAFLSAIKKLNIGK